MSDVLGLYAVTLYFGKHTYLLSVYSSKLTTTESS